MILEIVFRQLRQVRWHSFITGYYLLYWPILLVIGSANTAHVWFRHEEGGVLLLYDPRNLPVFNITNIIVM